MLTLSKYLKRTFANVDFTLAKLSIWINH